MINYYIILEIPNFSDQTVIKKAYRMLSKKYHPDVNNDPFAATYFLKINEAYNFLSDDNKRLLLHQFLNYQENSKTTEPQYHQQKNEAAKETVLKPIIEFFFCDRKSFSFNDYICIQWQVTNAKSIKINLFGNVALQGSQYYKVTKFVEELRIELHILGHDAHIYESTIVLPYSNEIPARKAYHQMLLNDANTKEIHFRNERLFHTHSRISRLTFINRVVLLTLLLLLSFMGYAYADFPHFYLIIICFLTAAIWVQFVKRFHDLVPVVHLASHATVDFSILKDLFCKESVNSFNKFGMYPDQEQLKFLNWITSYMVRFSKERTVIEKASVLLFGFVILFYSYQSLRNYNEREINLTDNRVAINNQQSRSSAYNVYQLQFNNGIWLDVTQNEYYEVVEKRYDAFVMGVNAENEIKYVKALNRKNNTSKKLGTGLMSNANPLILVLTLLFLGQIYVITQFNKPDEKFYGAIYLGFTIFVYIIILTGYLM